MNHLGQYDFSFFGLMQHLSETIHYNMILIVLSSVLLTYAEEEPVRVKGKVLIAPITYEMTTKTYLTLAKTLGVQFDINNASQGITIEDLRHLDLRQENLGIFLKRIVQDYPSPQIRYFAARLLMLSNSDDAVRILESFYESSPDRLLKSVSLRYLAMMGNAKAERYAMAKLSQARSNHSRTEYASIISGLARRFGTVELWKTLWPDIVNASTPNLGRQAIATLASAPPDWRTIDLIVKALSLSHLDKKARLVLARVLLYTTLNDFGKSSRLGPYHRKNGKVFTDDFIELDARKWRHWWDENKNHFSFENRCREALSGNSVLRYICLATLSRNPVLTSEELVPLIGRFINDKDEEPIIHRLAILALSEQKVKQILPLIIKALSYGHPSFVSALCATELKRLTGLWLGDIQEETYYKYFESDRESKLRGGKSAIRMAAEWQKWWDANHLKIVWDNKTNRFAVLK